MKKIIGAALVATLMGSLSANAAVILEDNYTVAGGVGGINDGIGVTRQLSGLVTSTYTHGGLGTASIVNDFGNGGTARITGQYNAGNGSTLSIDADAGGLVAGTEWEFGFTLFTPVTGGTIDQAWAGFGIGTASYPSSGAFGEFSLITRNTGAFTLLQNGATATLASGISTFNSFGHIMVYSVIVDELDNEISLSYTALDNSLNIVGTQDLGTYSVALSSSVRKLSWAVQADTATNADILTYVENTTVETIPEPATLGLVAVVGGALLFIRRMRMI